MRGTLYSNILLLLLIAAMSSCNGSDTTVAPTMAVMEEERQPVVVIIDPNEIPEKPKPPKYRAIQKRYNDSIRIDLKSSQFGSSFGRDSAGSATGQVELGEMIPCINPYKNLKTRCIDEIDERPHYKECLVANQYHLTSFQCTMDKLYAYVRNEMTIPPCVHYSGGKQLVQALVVVEETGVVETVKVLNTDAVCADCAVEAKRVLKSLPRMEPGVYGGAPVRISFTLPITFEAP